MGCGCFCRMGREQCFESKSVWLVRSGTVTSSICGQGKLFKGSEKVSSGCVEVLKMRIGEEYKIAQEADENMNSRPRTMAFADPLYVLCANSVILLDCT